MLTRYMEPLAALKDSIVPTIVFKQVVQPGNEEKTDDLRHSPTSTLH